VQKPRQYAEARLVVQANHSILNLHLCFGACKAISGRDGTDNIQVRRVTEETAGTIYVLEWSKCAKSCSAAWLSIDMPQCDNNSKWVSDLAELPALTGSSPDGYQYGPLILHPLCQKGLSLECIAKHKCLRVSQQSFRQVNESRLGNLAVT
jgi:hypothetical protein